MKNARDLECSGPFSDARDCPIHRPPAAPVLDIKAITRVADRLDKLGVAYGNKEFALLAGQLRGAIAG